MAATVTRISLIVLADPPVEAPEFDGCVHDHEERGADQLIYIYRTAKTIALLRTLLAAIQDAENGMCLLPTAYWIEHATGIRLDILGRIVGEERAGRSDQGFAAGIRGRVAANRSSGVTEHVIRVLKAVVGPNVRVRIGDEPPAAFTAVILDGIDTTAGTELAKLLQVAKAAGVRALLTWHGAGNAFRFSQSGTPVSSSAYGFGAGRLAAVSDGRAMAGW
jgi:hypothetical protein